MYLKDLFGRDWTGAFMKVNQTMDLSGNHKLQGIKVLFSKRKFFMNVNVRQLCNQCF